METNLPDELLLQNSGWIAARRLPVAEDRITVLSAAWLRYERKLSRLDEVHVRGLEPATVFTVARNQR